jgi:hypothetical protein
MEAALQGILGTGYDNGNLSRCHDIARAALAAGPGT